MAESTGTQTQATPTQAQESTGQTVETPQNDAMAELQKAFELQKKEIAGLNRTVSEKEKAIKDIELAKLSAEDRAKAQTQAEIDELKAIADKERKTTLNLKKQNKVVGVGLKPEFANHINATTDEEIDEAIKLLKNTIDAEVKAQVEKARNEFYGGKAPTGGTPVHGKIATLEQFNAMNPKDRSAFMSSGGTIKD